MHEEYSRGIPIGRIGRPDEIAVGGRAFGPQGPRRVRRPDDPGQRRVDDGAGHERAAESVAGRRYASCPDMPGLTTFARLPRIEDVDGCDVAVVGIPFDTGVSYRPGARFGPAHIRQCSRVLRPYNPRWRCRRSPASRWSTPATSPVPLTTSPPRCGRSKSRRRRLIDSGAKIVTPRRRPHHRLPPAARTSPPLRTGGVGALRRSPRHVGHVFRRTADPRHPVSARRGGGPVRRRPQRTRRHSRGAVHAGRSRRRMRNWDSPIVHCSAFETRTVADVVEQLRTTIGDHPLYVSIDIDVLDPAHAPLRAHPRSAACPVANSSRLVRGFEGLNLVGADIVEVAPAYDHAEITGIAAAYLAYEFVSLLAQKCQPMSLPAAPVPWPNGARCAASFSFDVDAESAMLGRLHQARQPDVGDQSPGLRAPYRYPAAAGNPCRTRCHVHLLRAGLHRGALPRRDQGDRRRRTRDRASRLPPRTHVRSDGERRSRRSSTAAWKHSTPSRACGPPAIARRCGS